MATLTLTIRNLSFRGYREKIRENCGLNGNFIYLIQLYDPILQNVINKPKGQTKHLSFAI